VPRTHLSSTGCIGGDRKKSAGDSRAGLHKQCAGVNRLPAQTSSSRAGDARATSGVRRTV
jgi:hypothetical protein